MSRDGRIMAAEQASQARPGRQSAVLFVLSGLALLRILDFELAAWRVVGFRIVPGASPESIR